MTTLTNQYWLANNFINNNYEDFTKEQCFIFGEMIGLCCVSLNIAITGIDVITLNCDIDDIEEKIIQTGGKKYIEDQKMDFDEEIRKLEPVIDVIRSLKGNKKFINFVNSSNSEYL